MLSNLVRLSGCAPHAKAFQFGDESGKAAAGVARGAAHARNCVDVVLLPGLCSARRSYSTVAPLHPEKKKHGYWQEANLLI